jgi:probable addiction module antidote protein
MKTSSARKRRPSARKRLAPARKRHSSPRRLPPAAVLRLGTSEGVADYLSKAFRGDPDEVPLAIVTAARSTNMIHLTRAADVSRSNLYRLAGGERGDLKLRTALRLIKALGMNIEVTPKRRR